MDNQLNTSKVLRKRERLFCLAYTDRTNTKTYQNATQSCLKAGYSTRNCASQGSRMLKKPSVAQWIRVLEKEANDRRNISLEDKIRIAWDNYLQAMTEGRPQIAQRWYREHGELSQHYVQHVESHSKIEDITNETADHLTKYVRSIRENLN